MSTPPQTTAATEPAAQEPLRDGQESVRSNVPSVVHLDPKLQELIKEFTCEISPDDAAEPCKPRNFRHPPNGNEDAAWGECFRHIESHDDDLCKGFREEIDTLLVFAGLFSAIVGSFSVEAYQWLAVSPTDVNNNLLVHAVVLLVQNATGADVLAPAPTLTGAVAVRINAYWFLSLTLSLTSALIGILCKQWVRQFSHQPRTTGPELVGVRQMKYEGLQAWKVGEIISFLPLLLQLALGVFFLGILEMLWTLHRSVAAVVTAAASVTLIFYLATTFVPAIQHLLLFSTRTRLSRSGVPQCPYKSPQSLLVLRLMTAIFAIRVPSIADDEESQVESRADSHPFDSWVLFDGRYDSLCNRSLPTAAPKSHWRGLAWLLETTSRPGLRDHVWHCLWANALRHTSGSHTTGAHLHSSPGPWHVLRTDPRTEYISNVLPEPEPYVTAPRLHGVPEPQRNVVPHPRPDGIPALHPSTNPAPQPDTDSALQPNTGNELAQPSRLPSQTWWAAAIVYSAGTSFNETTRLEIYIRGLSTWITSIDPLTAYHVLDIVLPDAALKVLKPGGLPGSLVRCAVSFYHKNSGKCVLGMAHFLRKVAACLAADTTPSADAHLACLCILYTRWLREWIYYDSVAIVDNSATMIELVVRRVKRRTKRAAHNQRTGRLGSLPHIEDFAELLVLVTLPYWNHVARGSHSPIEWDRFPLSLRPILQDNEKLFRRLIFIGLVRARCQTTSIRPHTISTPITSQEIEYLEFLRRSLVPGGQDDGQTPAPVTTPETARSATNQQHPVLAAAQLVPIAPRDPASVVQGAFDGREEESPPADVVGIVEGTPHDATLTDVTPAAPASEPTVTFPGNAAYTTIPRPIPGTDTGPELILPFIGARQTAELRRFLTAPSAGRPARTMSVPSLRSLPSARSESPDSRIAGSGGSIASAETARSMLERRGQHARTIALRRRETAPTDETGAARGIATVDSCSEVNILMPGAFPRKA